MTIIAVDQDRNSLNTIQEIISGIDFPFLCLKSFVCPSEALSFADCNCCDIAFIGLGKQETHGLFLAERLKELNPRINIIFFAESPDQAELAFSVRASGYRIKPITRDKIISELKDLRFINPELLSQYTLAVKK